MLAWCLPGAIGSACSRAPDGWMARRFRRSPPALGQRCARLAGVVLGQPDRQAGAALGSHHRYCSPGTPSAPDRLARRSVNPGFRRGSHRESGLQRRWPLPGKTPWAATKSARPTSAGRVLSINPRGGIDLGTLDAVALPPDCSVGSLTDSMGNRRRRGGHARRPRLHAPHARCGF